MTIGWGIPGGREGLAGGLTTLFGRGENADWRKFFDKQDAKDAVGGDTRTPEEHVKERMAEYAMGPPLSQKNAGRGGQVWHKYALAMVPTLVDEARQLPAVISSIRAEMDNTDAMLNRLNIRGGQADRIRKNTAAQWMRTLAGLQGQQSAGLAGMLSARAITGLNTAQAKHVGGGGGGGADPWAQALGGIAGAAGTAIGGPIGGAIGDVIGGAIGDLF